MASPCLHIPKRRGLVCEDTNHRVDYIFPFIKKVTNLDLLVQTIKEKSVLIVHVKYDLYLYLKNKYNDSKLISIREAWGETPELLYDLEYWKTK